MHNAFIYIYIYIYDYKVYTYAECTPLMKASIDTIGVSGKIP